MPKLKAESHFDAKLSTSDAALLLGVSSERVRQLSKAGWFARDEQGRIRLGNLVQGYAKSLKARGDKGTADAEASQPAPSTAQFARPPISIAPVGGSRSAPRAPIWFSIAWSA
jgi:hypothetical protein